MASRVDKPKTYCNRFDIESVHKSEVDGSKLSLCHFDICQSFWIPSILRDFSNSLYSQYAVWKFLILKP